MKKVIIIAVLLPLFALAQKKVSETNFPEVSGEINYTEVVNVDTSIKKDELFNRTKAWFVDNYKSANDVIQMQDKDAGIIMGKGIFTYGYNPVSLSDRVTVNISHTVKIYVKDGKYKYEITDLSGRYYSTGGYSNLVIKNDGIGYNKRNYEKLCESINASVLQTIASLKKAMQKPITSKDF